MKGLGKLLSDGKVVATVRYRVNPASEDESVARSGMLEVTDGPPLKFGEKFRLKMPGIRQYMPEIAGDAMDIIVLGSGTRVEFQQAESPR